MNPLHLLILLFVAVPIAEIYLLLEVGGVIGALPTIGLVVLTAVVGAALVRAQGFSTIQHVRRTMDAGEVPAVAIIEGIFLLLAGALLLTPGFLTDAIGFCFLVLPCVGLSSFDSLNHGWFGPTMRRQVAVTSSKASTDAKNDPGPGVSVPHGLGTLLMP